MAIDRDSRINIGEAPGPRHLYAIPPRARPLLRAVSNSAAAPRVPPTITSTLSVISGIPGGTS